MTDTRRWFWIGGLALLVAFVVLLHTDRKSVV